MGDDVTVPWWYWKVSPFQAERRLGPTGPGEDEKIRRQLALMTYGRPLAVPEGPSGAQE